MQGTQIWMILSKERYHRQISKGNTKKREKNQCYDIVSGRSIEQADFFSTRVILQKSWVIRTKFVEGQNSTSTKVILHDIWGTQNKIWSRLTSTSTKVILQKIVCHRDKIWSRPGLLQRSFYRKFGELRTNLEQANLHLYIGHIAENLGSSGQIWSRPNFYFYNGHLAKNFGTLGPNFTLKCLFYKTHIKENFGSLRPNFE